MLKKSNWSPKGSQQPILTHFKGQIVFAILAKKDYMERMKAIKKTRKISLVRDQNPMLKKKEETI